MISNNHSFEVHDEEIEEKRGNLLTAAFKKKRKMKCHQKYHLLHPKEIQYFFFHLGLQLTWCIQDVCNTTQIKINFGWCQKVDLDSTNQRNGFDQWFKNHPDQPS